MASTGVSNAASYGTVTIGAAAALIKAAVTTRKSILVQNVHASNTLYVGDDSSVTTANGIRLLSGESIEINDYNGAVYGIASGAGTDVRYFEVA